MAGVLANRAVEPNDNSVLVAGEGGEDFDVGLTHHARRDGVLEDGVLDAVDQPVAH